MAEALTRVVGEDRPSRLLRWAFAAFVGLAVVHAPVVTIGGDAIGLFDLYVAAVFGLVALFRLRTLRLDVHPDLRLVLGIYCAFLAFAVALFCINFLLFPQRFEMFSMAVLIKQVQYLMIGLVTAFFLTRIPTDRFYRYVYFVIGVVGFNGFYQMFVTGTWYRLGLINMEGESSSNPAGFVLASALLLLAMMATDPERRFPGSRLVLAGWFAIGYFALFLTFSRTNNLALIAALALYLAIRFRLLRLLVRGLPLLVVLYIAAVAMVDVLQIDAYKELPIRYILDPSLIWTDNSMAARIEEKWYLGSEQWLSSPVHLLVGTGLGTVRLTDGLLPHILYTTGFIGLVLYYSVFAVLLWRFPLEVRVFTILMLLNSVAAETTVLSFRTMQIFLIFLVYVLLRYRRERPEVVPASGRVPAAAAAPA